MAGLKLITGVLADEIRKLKEQPGKDLLLSGSAQLFNELMDQKLIDLYRFMVHPTVMGKGKRLFGEGVGKRVLELTDTKRFSKGITVLEYTPAKAG
jgi:dihydrofolate reductase